MNKKMKYDAVINIGTGTVEEVYSCDIEHLQKANPCILYRNGIKIGLVYLRELWKKIKIGTYSVKKKTIPWIDVFLTIPHEKTITRQSWRLCLFGLLLPKI